MTIAQAAKVLEEQLLRQVDATAGARGGWNSDASAYLGAYKAAHPGGTIGIDQWGNAVPLFGTAAGYQRVDATIFSANPSKANPPQNLGIAQVLDYGRAAAKSALSDVWSTVTHPIDTITNGILGTIGIIKDPEGEGQKILAGGRNVFNSAGAGNFAPAGELMGTQIGGAIVDLGVPLATVKALDVFAKTKAANVAAAEAAKATSLAGMEGNFYRDGSIVEVDVHLGRFVNGASFIGPITVIQSYNPMGRADGLYVRPSNYMDRILGQTQGVNPLIKQALGIPSDDTAWDAPLSRVDIPNPLLLNPRLPTGLEAAANKLFIRGGYTSGGTPEIVIDPVWKNLVRETPIQPPGKKRE